MLLQVNDVDFQNMSNDDAVRVLREMVHKPGPITLTVAKCWDPSPQDISLYPRVSSCTDKRKPNHLKLRSEIFHFIINFKIYVFFHLIG